MQFRLLVEGSDDRHLITNLLREHGIALAWDEVRECIGDGTLLNESLPMHLQGSYDVIGIVIDADVDLGARWQSIRDRLRNHGYVAPNVPPTNGVILRDRKPHVGIRVMPDNSLPGTLEDFVKELIEPDDQLWPLAVGAVAAIPDALRRFTVTRKAEVHTFLAWQEDPGTPLGLAITKKYFRTDGALAHRFATWFRALRSPA